MKIKYLIGVTLTAVALGGLRNGRAQQRSETSQMDGGGQSQPVGCASHGDRQAPNGTIKESELEKEHGKLIWSFDIATPGTTDITEVNVDAITGKVVPWTKKKPRTKPRKQKARRKKINFQNVAADVSPR